MRTIESCIYLAAGCFLNLLYFSHLSNKSHYLIYWWHIWWRWNFQFTGDIGDSSNSLIKTTYDATSGHGWHATYMNTFWSKFGTVSGWLGGQKWGESFCGRVSYLVLSRQVSLLKSFQHKNVVRLLDVLDIGILTEGNNEPTVGLRL